MGIQFIVGWALETHFSKMGEQQNIFKLLSTECRDKPRNIIEMTTFHAWVKKK